MKAVKIGLSFVDRVGSVLVAPREAARGVLAGRGGLSDVMWLLGLRLLAGEASPLIARALLGARSRGLDVALVGVLRAVSTLAPEVLGIFVGGLVLSLALGRKASGKHLDLAALGWIPFVTVRASWALALTVAAKPSGAGAQRVVDLIALGWAAVVFGVAWLEAGAPFAPDTATSAMKQQGPQP